LELILKANPKTDTTEYVIVENIEHVNYSDYSKVITSFEKIDNYNAKIVVPKKHDNGLTGVYIDSLWVTGSGIDKFNLYGFNLSKNNQEEFLKVIKTLKFKPNK